MSLEIRSLVVSPFLQNCYLLSCSETKEAMLIDPGGEPERILKVVEAEGLKLKWIMATHTHVDHVSAVAALQESLDLPFYMHKQEEMILDSLVLSQQFYGYGDQKMPKITGFFTQGDRFSLGELDYGIIETPGHTPGGVCFDFGKSLFVGDTLFQGSIGRTDLPGGNYNMLMSSIKNKLWALDDDVTVFSGHGEPTTIGVEKTTNPFLT